MSDLSNLKSSFALHPTILKTISLGVSYAAELHHSVLAEYHCYYAVLQNVPTVSVSNGPTKTEFGADQFGAIIRKLVRPGQNFKKVTMVPPTMWQAFHSAISDAAHRRRPQVGWFDLMLAPLVRPLDTVHQIILASGISPEALVEPILSTLDESDEKAAVHYYTGLYKLLNSTYPYPIIGIREPRSEQLDAGDIECIPGYKAFRTKDGNICVVPIDRRDKPE